jgi:hypothetical protein
VPQQGARPRDDQQQRRDHRQKEVLDHMRRQQQPTQLV